ncbi:MAG: hypothetical protein JXN61_07175, partial [Sedimentisphaerales bacterium]|nr:hypothetical protein [Sedimentisphaerales bacterium]
MMSRMLWRFVTDDWKVVMLSRKAGIAALLVAVLVSSAVPAQPALTIVADGKAAAVIVVSSKASPAATEGAEIIRDHLLRISGARLDILKENELPDVKVENGRVEAGTTAQAFILVGEGNLTTKLGTTSKGLGPGGIRIRTFDNGLAMLGPDDRTPSDPYGTRYAVTTFLENELGCRYLWPGETGKVVPRKTTITIEPLDIRFTPFYEQ